MRPARDMCSVGRSFQLLALTILAALPQDLSPRLSTLGAATGTTPTLWLSVLLTVLSLGKVGSGWPKAEIANLLAGVTQQGPVLAAASGVDLGSGANRLVPGDALAWAEKKNGLWALLLLV